MSGVLRGKIKQDKVRKSLAKEMISEQRPEEGRKIPKWALRKGSRAACRSLQQPQGPQAR